MTRSALQCPHCSALGIPLAAKRRATREHPAECTVCGGLSHVLGSTGSGIPVMTLFVAGAFFLAAIVLGVSAWWGLAGLPAAIGYNAWAWRRAELFPISRESATHSRRGGWAANILAIFTIFWS